MSVVPPPMSTTMLPDASVIGMPAPIAAAIASSMRCTSLAFARIALSLHRAALDLRDLRRHADDDARTQPVRCACAPCG